jgi:DNA-binding transcriptional regulator YbjK
MTSRRSPHGAGAVEATSKVDASGEAPRNTGARGAYARGREREERLLEALLRIVAREGLSAVSHRSAAEEARIPTGSVSYYFPKRIDLVRGAFSHLARRQLERIETIAAEQPAASLTSVADFATRVLMGELQRDSIASAVAEFELVLAISRDPELAPEYREFQQRLVAIQERIAKSVGSTNPERDGRIVQAFLRGVQLEALASRPEERPSPGAVRSNLLHLLRSLVGSGRPRADSG